RPRRRTRRPAVPRAARRRRDRQGIVDSGPLASQPIGRVPGAAKGVADRRVPPRSLTGGGFTWGGTDGAEARRATQGPARRRPGVVSLRRGSALVRVGTSHPRLVA